MRQFLEKATGVDTYLIISLMIFLLFFITMAVWLVRANKDHINKIKNMPLDNNKPSNTSNS